MSRELVTPCGQLGEAERVARVASAMDTAGMVHPPFPLKPGICRFCGHSLPYAYSATLWHEDAPKRAEWSQGEPMGDKLELMEAGRLDLGAGTALVYRKHERPMKHTGLRRLGDEMPDVLLSPNGACASLTEDVFRRASVVARERGARAAAERLARTTARERVARQAAAAAARAMRESGEGSF